MMLDLTPSAHQALVDRAAELERLGFEVEPFGAATIKVTAVPALLNAEDCAKALLALAEDLEGLDRGAQVQDALQRIAATTACHAAVKANYPLTYEKMTHILDELRATAYSTRLPARPSGDAAADATRDRKELRPDLSAGAVARRSITSVDARTARRDVDAARRHRVTAGPLGPNPRLFARGRRDVSRRMGSDPCRATLIALDTPLLRLIECPRSLSPDNVNSSALSKRKGHPVPCRACLRVATSGSAKL